MHRFFICLAIATGVYAQTPAAPMSTTLKVGDTAPDFTLPSTSGKPVSLADFHGKKTVVLAFFPAAFTGGCTSEMQKYQLGVDKFQTADTQVFGISEDNTPSQKEFAAKLNLAFPLLSDFTDRHVATEYGVLVPSRGIANRVTFVIDPDGKIAFMEQGKDAIETMGAAEACGRLAHRAAASK
jgi:peroxiredoxin